MRIRCRVMMSFVVLFSTMGVLGMGEREGGLGDGGFPSSRL